jgi:beta-glucosidase
MGFRDDFVWGGATGAYWVEGAAREDGKGLSVWDMFAQDKNHILDEQNGDITCDHYHLYQKDVDVMKEIGYKGYRFSISWPRVIPEGKGNVNEKGLDFYDRLIDSLLKAGISPYATLFMWDYPYALFRKGGWLNPDSPKWYVDYVMVIAKKLGDRLKNYFTFNEPQCFIGYGHHDIFHAPGVHFPIQDTLLMTHHVLLAHGNAVQTLRALVPNAKIGWASAGSGHYPISNNSEDREAARLAFFDIPKNNPYFSVSLWCDPIYLGSYPAKFIEQYGQHMPPIGQNDMNIINQPLDFTGQNMYNGQPIRSDGKGGYEFVTREPGYPLTAYKWPITPESLYWTPVFLAERYKKPILITENGISCHDVISLDNKVHDPNRIDFMNRYLLSLRRAVDDGVDVQGYFYWTVMDNFECAQGFMERFGMVYTNYKTKERVLKDSAYWYRNVIKTNGSNL